MKRIILVGCLCFAWVAHAEMVDRIAAVVNNDIIPLSEVEAKAAPELIKAQQLPSPQARAEGRQKALHQALDTLIGERLLESEMKELNIDVSDQELDMAIEDVKKQNLAANVSDEQFEQALKQEGYTLETYKDFLRKHLRRTKLLGLKVRNKVRVSEEDLKSEYQKYVRMESSDAEVHARHILVKTSPHPTAAELETAQKKAQAISAEARQPGVDFAELAKKKSEGSSAQDGGDLGYFRRGVMQAQIERAAFALKVGEVSEPIKSSYGFHVLKVEDRRSVPVKSFDEMKDALRERLLKDQLDKYTDQYVQELRQGAVVDVKI